MCVCVKENCLSLELTRFFFKSMEIYLFFNPFVMARSYYWTPTRFHWINERCSIVGYSLLFLFHFAYTQWFGDWFEKWISRRLAITLRFNFLVSFFQTLFYFSSFLIRQDWYSFLWNRHIKYSLRLLYVLHVQFHIERVHIL